MIHCPGELAVLSVLDPVEAVRAARVGGRLLRIPLLFEERFRSASLSCGPTRRLVDGPRAGRTRPGPTRCDLGPEQPGVDVYGLVNLVVAMLTLGTPPVGPHRG